MWLRQRREVRADSNEVNRLYPFFVRVPCLVSAESVAGVAVLNRMLYLGRPTRYVIGASLPEILADGEPAARPISMQQSGRLGFRAPQVRDTRSGRLRRPCRYSTCIEGKWPRTIKPAAVARSTVSRSTPGSHLQASRDGDIRVAAGRGR